MEKLCLLSLNWFLKNRFRRYFMGLGFLTGKLRTHGRTPPEKRAAALVLALFLRTLMKADKWFHILMSCVSLFFLFPIQCQLCLSIKEGGCLWINTSLCEQTWAMEWCDPPGNCCCLGMKALDLAKHVLSLKCICTYIGLVGFADLRRGQGPLPHDNCR